MQVVIKGKNLDITDALREHALAKVTKVEKLDLGYRELEVKLVVKKNPSIKQNQIAEMTLTGNGPLIRAEDRDFDMYVAIDKAVAKLLRQIKKYHEKRIERTQARESALRGQPVEFEPEAVTAETTIVRSKVVALKPMAPEEAALQMDMLGHDFYVFTNEATESVNVVYRRNDGNYGLIETSR